LRWAVASLLLLALLPVTPLLFAVHALRRRRTARQRRRFRLVTRVEPNGATLVVHCADGEPAVVAPSELRNVRHYEWGDGINGEACEIGLELDDRLLIRGDAWRDVLGPVIAAVQDKQVGRIIFAPHPDVPEPFLAFFAIVGAAVDVIILVLVLSRR
jgi:hypothetical protein